MTNSFDQKTHSEHESTEYFRQFWQHATAEDYAYPRLVPRTQWDLYEREKARLVMTFLQRTGKHGGRVLEYGCGSAGMSVYLANQGYEVWATDITPEAMHIARDNWTANATNAAPLGLPLAVADALRLPFVDNAFDVVMSYGLLEHFDERAIASCLQESYRVLNPGGVLLGDIVHSRFSARKVAIGLNFVVSAVYHFLRGQWHKVPSLYHGYFHAFYENTLGLTEWKECLQRNGFMDVQILCIRPFPPLAVTGVLEKLYIRLMETMLPFYRWFDESQSWLSKRWGWTYLFCATKLA